MTKTIPPRKPTKLPKQPLKITIFIPQDLGLKQADVDAHLDKFFVEVAGTLGNTKGQKIQVIAVDGPPNDY